MKLIKVYLRYGNLYVYLTGFLYTEEPVRQAFTLNERIEMRINVSSVLNIAPTIIRSLVWSHNGTELASDGRHSIGHNGTSLTISNMVQSDAGKYEVKINSTYLDDEGGICDKNFLPMLANLAFFAPVTFVLQEFSVSTFYPEDVISDYAVPAYQGSTDKTLDFENVFMINLPAVFDYSILYEFLYKDGVSITNMPSFHRTISYGNVTTQSLRITYNNTEDITGHYYYGADLDSTDIDRDICPQYRYYLDYTSPFPPVFSLHWNIRSYSELK